MEHNPNDLNVLAYVNGFTLWHYKTQSHPMDGVVSPEGDYFGNAADMIEENDVILCTARDETSILIVSGKEPNKVYVRKFTL